MEFPRELAQQLRRTFFEHTVEGRVPLDPNRMSLLINIARKTGPKLHAWFQTMLQVSLGIDDSYFRCIATELTGDACYKLFEGQEIPFILQMGNQLLKTVEKRHRECTAEEKQQNLPYVSSFRQLANSVLKTHKKELKQVVSVGIPMRYNLCHTPYDVCLDEGKMFGYRIFWLGYTVSTVEYWSAEMIKFLFGETAAVWSDV